MTTPSEWTEIVEWIADRFPDRPWAVEQALAYYYDLEGFDTTDVWTAVMALYEDGQRFAPNGSQILAEARKEQRRAARPEQQPMAALPAADHDPGRIGKWIERTFGENLSGQAIVERLHREQKPCNNPGCDIHYPAEVGGTK